MPTPRRYQLAIRATLEDTSNKGPLELAAQARQQLLLLPARIPDPQVHVAWVGMNVTRQTATGQCSCNKWFLNRYTDDQHGRWADTEQAQADVDAHLQEVLADA